MTFISSLAPDPLTASPTDYGLPDWVTDIREPQRQAVDEILNAYREGARVVFLDGPTGSGKTLIAELVRLSLVRSKGLYIATTRALQDQFAKDFTYARVLKGRSNYPTLDAPELFDDRFHPLSAADCLTSVELLPACDGCPKVPSLEREPHCFNCHPFDRCPYQVARTEALEGQLAVTNTAYFITEANGPGRFSDASGAGNPDPFSLVVVDEADTLEQQLMSFVDIEVSATNVRRWNLGQPVKVSVAQSWHEWVVEAVRKMKSTVAGLDTAARANPSDRKRITELKRARGLLGNLMRLDEAFNEPETHPAWVYDPKQHHDGKVVFRPVTVEDYGAKCLWEHAGHWLLMSASLISTQEMAESTGLTLMDGWSWRTVSMPSNFPVENRPVRIIPGPAVSARTREESEPVIAELVAEVGRLHPEDRILVHTVSYRLAEVFFDCLRRDAELRGRLVQYSSGKEKDAALSWYINTPGAIMLAPSLDRGTDLPEDLCRVQVIAKVPFLFLDAQTSARLYGTGQAGQLWYDVATIRTLVQMTGRGIRSETDHAETFILDGQFMKLWNKRRMMFPAWWREAVDFSGTPELQSIVNLSHQSRTGS
jgi:ATP-dependent DNA helicase DinG